MARERRPLAEERQRQRDQRPGDHQRRPARRATAQPGGRRRPRRAGAPPPRLLPPDLVHQRDGVGSSGPACSTSIGSLLDVGPVARCARPAARPGWRRTRCSATISSCAGGRVRYSISATASARVLGALDEPDAGEVGVRAGAVLVGPRGRDGEVGLVLEDRAPR